MLRCISTPTLDELYPEMLLFLLKQQVVRFKPIHKIETTGANF